MLFTVRQYKRDGLYTPMADELLFEDEFRNILDAVDCILARSPSATVRIEGEPLGNIYYSIRCNYDYAEPETIFYKL